MSETTCNHHWHSAGNGIDVVRGERLILKVCCHCGADKEIRYPLHQGGSVAWTYDRSECGPHAPDDTPMFDPDTLRL